MPNDLLYVIGFIVDNQLVPWLAGLLWIGWLVAVLTLIFFARIHIDLSVRRRIVALPITAYIIWQGLILITLGQNPIVKRDDIIDLLRFLNLFTAVTLWFWLFVYLKKNKKV